MKDDNSLEAVGDVVGIGVSELPEVHLSLGVRLCQEADLHLEVHPCQEGQEGLLAKCCVQPEEVPMLLGSQWLFHDC